MEMNTTGKQLMFSILDTPKAVKALRDSGYMSTTHALAELIDNSIESGSTSIEVFGVTQRDDSTKRFTLKELAVLDNGGGMDAETLRRSLRYGDGTRRVRGGIGRFGVGLPNSSMSQARQADVWSWQSGITNAQHTRLSLDDINAGLDEIPKPMLKNIPDVYRDKSRMEFGDSGTLVVWSDLDRVEWKRASTTFRHTEALLGRIYRRFLAKPSERLHSDDPRNDIGSQRTIQCIPIQQIGNTFEIEADGIVEVRPNDPLYLMSGTSCPEEFGPSPMFIELEGSPFSVPVKYNGQEYPVRVRAAYARAYVRDSSDPEATWPEKYAGQDAGNAPWGKHAAQNMGVSLIRAHREVMLDTSWVSGDDPRERWWTVEVDFPTDLDEMFGVTNNKQGTVTFQRLALFDWKREALPDETSLGDVRRRMQEEGDPRASLLDLRKQIENAIKLMRPRVRAARQSRGKRHVQSEDQKADAKVTAAVKHRIEKGHKGESDLAGESATEQEQKDKQVESLVVKHHIDEQDALRQIDETIKAGNLVRWIQSSQSSPAFFDVEALPGLLQVALNTDHPVYSHLYEIIHPDVEELTEDEVRERLAKAAAAFRVLIYSWARYEDEQTGRDQRQVRDARWEWGKYAEEFFDEDDGSIDPTDLV